MVPRSAVCWSPARGLGRNFPEEKEGAFSPEEQVPHIPHLLLVVPRVLILKPARHHRGTSQARRTCAPEAQAPVRNPPASPGRPISAPRSPNPSAGPFPAGPPWCPPWKSAQLSLAGLPRAWTVRQHGASVPVAASSESIARASSSEFGSVYSTYSCIDCLVPKEGGLLASGCPGLPPPLRQPRASWREMQVGGAHIPEPLT